MKTRVRKLERRLGIEPAIERCPTCASKIVYVEELADGTEVWPDGEGPCQTCDNKSPIGGVGKIVVVHPSGHEPAQRMGNVGPGRLLLPRLRPVKLSR